MLVNKACNTVKYKTKHIKRQLHITVIDSICLDKVTCNVIALRFEKVMLYHDHKNPSL